MKRFRFPLETLLDVRRRSLQGLEAGLAAVEARRAEARERVEGLERRSRATRDSIDGARPLCGADLRAAAAASEGMLLQARAAQRTANALDRQAAEARRKVLRARREVETVERLRDQSLAAWRREAEREEEALAAELFLTRWPRRDNQ